MIKVDIKEQKNLIRKEFKVRRSEMSASEVKEQSKQICQNFINNLLPKLLKQFQDPIFSVYLAANNEVDTITIIDYLIKNNIKFALPKIANDQINLDYILHDNNLSYVQNSQFRTITEPHSGEETTPNILIVPLVVFDQNKNRIGMAKGFFDRSIESVKGQKSQIVTIGLGFSIQQYSQDIPCEDHDQTLDYIVSNDFIVS